MKMYSAEMVKIVVNGSALVEPCAMATELTHIKTPTTGAGNKHAVKMMHWTQFFPFICRYILTEV